MNIIRYYNQNRKMVWGMILIIIAIMVLLKILNYITIINSKNRIKSSKEESTKTFNSISSNSTYSSTKSRVTGGTKNQNELDNVQELLDKFYSSCNSKNLKEAYNLLTDECKELVYPTLESFQKNYYNNVFEDKIKNYYFENWYSDTYYVTIKEDILSTGKVSSDENKINDYVTIVGDKLNINTYVGRTQIDKVDTSKDIKITVNSKDTFMNYEIYNITVKNESDKTICLTSADSSDEVYIQDGNDVKYEVYNHELLPSQMIIDPGYDRNISFKFYSSYVSSKKIKRLVFKKLILDTSDSKNRDNIYEYMIHF